MHFPNSTVYVYATVTHGLGDAVQTSQLRYGAL